MHRWGRRGDLSGATPTRHGEAMSMDGRIGASGTGLLATTMALVGLCWAGWAGSVFAAAISGPSRWPWSPGPAATAVTVGFGGIVALTARQLRRDASGCTVVAIGVFALSSARVGPIMGLTGDGVAPWGAIAGLSVGSIAVAVIRSAALGLSGRGLPRLRWAMVVSLALVVALPGPPAGAWIASASLATPTATMLRTHNVDFAVDTHQWLANQAMVILAADGRSDVARFLATPDPKAPVALDPATGAPTATTETYGWRLMQGARDADGALYPQIPDHFHNWWTHRGRWWIVAGSAASGAEVAFSNAKSLWAQGDRSEAVRWLGAALHLVDDACVPQHEFFGLNVYHHQYERWVQIHQDQLAVTSGGIYADQFRVLSGHGGTGWSSAHPRGWVDECAHRAATNLLASTHDNPAQPSGTGPQWRTASHIADTQRLSAGFLAFFFREVGGP